MTKWSSSTVGEWEFSHSPIGYARVSAQLSKLSHMQEIINLAKPNTEPSRPGPKVNGQLMAQWSGFTCPEFEPS